MFHANFLLDLLFDPEDGGDNLIRQLNFTGLHGFMPHKVQHYTTGVGTSNPAYQPFVAISVRQQAMSGLAFWLCQPGVNPCATTARADV
jgi:hypothetical protein